MKKITIMLICVSFVVSLTLTACRPAPAPTAASQGATPISEPGPSVLAVQTFLADIAQNVTGDRAAVASLIPLGLDPHAFEPAPQDVARIAGSQVLIVNGAGFEEWLAETLENAGGERLVIEASAGLTSREAREGEEAVMSPGEKAESICVDLAEKPADELLIAGGDAASAARLHHEDEPSGDEEHGNEHAVELMNLKLKEQPDGTYAGFVLVDAHEAGEYLIASASGQMQVLDEEGAEVEAEDTLALACAGLAQGVLVDLEASEYTVSLSGFAAETTPFIAGPASEAHHHGHDEGDPHFWLDPNNAVTYVENIRDGLIQADPGGRETYTGNAAAYIAQLKDLDNWIKQQVAQIPAEQRLLVTNHESFGYFADRYGFKVIGTVIPSVSTGASPSAQQIARLVDRIRSTGTKAIFLETGSNPKLAEQIAAETGARVVTGLYTHSITEPGGNAPSYIDMMKANVEAIVQALK